MHVGNIDFLKDVRQRFAADIADRAVLELGAYDVNGSARPHWPGTRRYVGVDQCAGPGVDVVADAAKTVFEPNGFDTLLCLSMFEHDPHWADSLRHNLPWVKSGGLVILGWGAEGNCPHAPYPWAIVTVAEWHAVLATLPLAVVEEFFEHTRYTADCAGAYDVIARKQ
jgi:hypothetical protein